MKYYKHFFTDAGRQEAKGLILKIIFYIILPLIGRNTDSSPSPEKLSMPIAHPYMMTRPGRLFWNENPKCWVAKIYLKVPKNRILMIRNRCAAGFPVLGLFWKCPRFVCLKNIIYRGLFSKKKIWSLGTTLGWLWGPISRDFMQKNFCNFFNYQNMPKVHCI